MNTRTGKPEGYCRTGEGGTNLYFCFCPALLLYSIPLSPMRSMWGRRATRSERKGAPCLLREGGPPPTVTRGQRGTSWWLRLGVVVTTRSTFFAISDPTLSILDQVTHLRDRTAPSCLGNRARGGEERTGLPCCCWENTPTALSLPDQWHRELDGSFGEVMPYSDVMATRTPPSFTLFSTHSPARAERDGLSLSPSTPT